MIWKIDLHLPKFKSKVYFFETTLLLMAIYWVQTGWTGTRKI